MFDTASLALAALDALDRHGFDVVDVGLIANNVTGECDAFLGDAFTGLLSVGAQVAVPGKERSTAGTDGRQRVGRPVRAAPAADMLAIPPVGTVLVAGVFLDGLVQGPAGSAVRNMRALLSGLGLSTAHARMYEEGVRRGGALVLLRCGEVQLVDGVQRLLRSCGAIDIALRARGWREAGWYEFEPEERPFTRAEIMRERQRYGAYLPGPLPAWLPAVAPQARARASRVAQAAKKPATLRQGWRESASDGMATGLGAVVRVG